ncbi:MAG: hypothetical protein QMD01_04945 [Thermodesulfovibrionales bacterium]|nr:hypothetical protein [Thermodesulfovibrionales bacterium]
MSLICHIDNLKGNHELVICDSETAKNAHQELFRFNDNVYAIIPEIDNAFNVILNTVNSFNTSSPEFIQKIHLSLNWENLLRVCSWKAEKPVSVDVFILLRNAGITSQELQPFKAADINDMFPWLYYGKRFDILKKLCHIAKRQIEGHLKDHSIRIDSHLVAEDTKKVVASSL